MSQPVIHRFAHEVMATMFEVVIVGEEEQYARQAAGAVFAEIERLEAILNRFDPSSEAARISRLAPGEELAVSLELAHCLRIAAEVHMATNGAFDITVSPPVPGYQETRKPDAERLGGLSLMRNIALVQDSAPGEPLRLAVKFVRHATQVDFGGIGKGFALDRVIETLHDWGIRNALLHGGTSTTLIQGDMQWTFGIGGDFAELAGFSTITLAGGALSGSGTEVKGEHIVDPHTGLAARGHIAAWSTHPSAAVADALSTAFMVMTTAEVKAYCEAHAEAGAYVVAMEEGQPRVYLFGTLARERHPA